MITLIVLVLLFVALGAAAARFGADSRDGNDWKPYELGGSAVPRR